MNLIYRYMKINVNILEKNRCIFNFNVLFYLIEISKIKSQNIPENEFKYFYMRFYFSKICNI